MEKVNIRFAFSIFLLPHCHSVSKNAFTFVFTGVLSGDRICVIIRGNVGVEGFSYFEEDDVGGNGKIRRKNGY